MDNEAKSLSDVKEGQVFEIEDVDDAELQLKFLRLGFLKGKTRCNRRLRGGPVVIKRKGTEIALGEKQASKVKVKTGYQDGK